MDPRLLRSRMVLCSVSQQEMAESLGLSRSAFYRKMNGASEFTRDEIYKMKKALQLNDDSLIDIFFKS